MYIEEKRKADFVHYTTPVRNIVSGKNNIYIKREDLLPFSFGGNKARKAFLFFEDIEKGQYDYVVTYGTSSSNHCRVVSNMAASKDIPCLIIGPEEKSQMTYNRKMMHLFGAEQIYVPVQEVHDRIEVEMEQLKKNGYHPYFIEGGGHGNIGTQAYVDCYREICEFEKENGLHFDYIFFASGTGTTQAGLVCGQLLNHDKRKIVGISIARKNPRGRNVVLESIRSYLKYCNIDISEKDIDNATIFSDQYTDEGYGSQNAEIQRTIHDVLIRYGIPLDPTYTGKAFYGMQEYLKTEKISGRNILFIHTGGTPLFFDYLNMVTEFKIIS